MPFQEKDPLSEPVRNIVYGRVDRGSNKYDWMPIEATDNGNGLATLKTSATSSGGGSSNTAPATNAGANSATANPVQGVDGGKPLPVTGTFWQTTQPVSGTFWQATQPVSFGALPAGGNAIGTVIVTSAPALAAGSNAIGTVGVTSLPALSAGTNTIGSVIQTPTTSGTPYVASSMSTGSTTVAPTNLARRSLIIENPSTSATMYLSPYATTTTAVNGHTWKIPPGGSNTLTLNHAGQITGCLDTGTVTPSVTELI